MSIPRCAIIFGVCTESRGIINLGTDGNLGMGCNSRATNVIVSDKHLLFRYGILKWKNMRIQHPIFFLWCAVRKYPTIAVSNCDD